VCYFALEVTVPWCRWRAHEDVSMAIRLDPVSTLQTRTPTQAGSLCYTNSPEYGALSQKRLPGGPRTNGNHGTG
jgi:hypothetical protein